MTSRKLIFLMKPQGFAWPLRDFVSTVFAYFSLDMPESILQPTRRS